MGSVSAWPVMAETPSCDDRELIQRLFGELLPDDRYEHSEKLVDAATAHNCGNISFYKNGFVVDDGLLRNLTSPENREFISDLYCGVFPFGKSSLKASGPLHMFIKCSLCRLQSMII